MINVKGFYISYKYQNNYKIHIPAGIPSIGPAPSPLFHLHTSCMRVEAYASLVCQVQPGIVEFIIQLILKVHAQDIHPSRSNHNHHLSLIDQTLMGECLMTRRYT